MAKIDQICIAKSCVVGIGESYFGKESFNGILEWPRFTKKHCWNDNLWDSLGKNYNVTCRSLCVTYKAGSGLNDWIYWHLIQTTRDYRQYSAIALLYYSSPLGGSPRWLNKKWQEDFIVIWSDSSCNKSVTKKRIEKTSRNRQRRWVWCDLYCENQKECYIGL
jgi:hypothetical protein